MSDRVGFEIIEKNQRRPPLNDSNIPTSHIMSNAQLMFGLTAATSLLVYKVYKDQQICNLNLPPSPKSYPIIGHLLSAPSGYKDFTRLGEQLGEKIFSLTVFGTTIIVLNDKDDATNLFDKRSAVYSDRSCPTMVKEPSLFGWGDFASIVGYGDRWRKYRRLMNPWLTKQAVAAHHEYQEHATRKLLQKLLEDHENNISSKRAEAEIFLSISATLLRSIYGYQAATSDDHILVEAQANFIFLAKSSQPSSYLVNTLPILMYIPEWFPGAGWKRDAIKWRKRKDALVEDIYNIGLENMVQSELLFT
ncbi:O-methylsterigmatocystin oxidoreductase OS=Aspergillus parasiticus GN=ordA PE=3 SV=1 [Rhizoctonia solani AG-1 IB]|uniref:O-methylsterigmatocystin oxidoreductase n=1 Tax=Thanatephorus cucumeris (strain AG1-IB / isolate 7/3/14) TaxID=1108050 RepID=A0A0B7FFE6_THACB|nr:O-methylsterigmatocystin oxidoreductase OS=Aspergillus parasiticus GN=ordA PE=3 SV=1 [Rhizoctonia solani AG-1 IB]